MKRNHNLAPSSLRSEAVKLLEGLANLRDDAEGYRWLKSNFPYVIDGVSTAIVRHWAMNYEGPVYEPGRPDEELIRQYWVIPLRDSLRRVWRTPDYRTKEWGMFRISQDFFFQGVPDLVSTPLSNPSEFLFGLRPPEQTELLLLQLVKMAPLTKVCCNPECVAPYFIAPSRRYKFCSDVCAQFGQREHKRRWWSEHGEENRRARGI